MAEADARDTPDISERGIVAFGFTDYYELLGVDEDASADKIDNKFQENARRFHPDVSDSDNPTERFKHILRAKEVLLDEEERARYDDLGHEAYVEQEYGVNITVDGDPAGSGADESPDDDQFTGISDDVYNWERTRAKVLSNAPPFVWERFRSTWILRGTYITGLFGLLAGYAIVRTQFGASFPAIFPTTSGPTTAFNAFVIGSSIVALIVGFTSLTQMRRLNIGSPVPETPPPDFSLQIGGVFTVSTFAITYAAQNMNPWTAVPGLVQLRVPSEPIWISELTMFGIEWGSTIELALLIGLPTSALIAGASLFHALSSNIWHDRYIRAKYVIPVGWEVVAGVLFVGTFVGLVWGATPAEWLPLTPSGKIGQVLAISNGEATYGTVGILSLLLLGVFCIFYRLRIRACRQRDMSKVLSEITAS